MRPHVATVCASGGFADGDTLRLLIVETARTPTLAATAEADPHILVIAHRSERRCINAVTLEICAFAGRGCIGDTRRGFTVSWPATHLRPGRTFSLLQAPVCCTAADERNLTPGISLSVWICFRRRASLAHSEEGSRCGGGVTCCARYRQKRRDADIRHHFPLYNCDLDWHRGGSPTWSVSLGVRSAIIAACPMASATAAHWFLSSAALAALIFDLPICRA